MSYSTRSAIRATFAQNAVARHAVIDLRETAVENAPTRHACAEHRGDLVAYLRTHHGTIGFHVWKRPPYPSSLGHAETDNAWNAATRRHGGGGA